METNNYYIRDTIDEENYNIIEKYLGKKLQEALISFQDLPYYIELRDLKHYKTEIILILNLLVTQKKVKMDPNWSLNQNAIIYQLIRGICQTFDKRKIARLIELATEGKLIKEFEKNHHQDHIEYILTTKNGKIKFRKIIEEPLNNTFQTISNDPDLDVNCHQYTFVQLLHPNTFCPNENMQSSRAITSHISLSIKGVGYAHSYLKKENKIYDLTGNLIISDTDFSRLNTPEEISDISITDMEMLEESKLKLATKNPRDFFLHPDKYFKKSYQRKYLPKNPRKKEKICQ